MSLSTASSRRISHAVISRPARSGAFSSRRLPGATAAALAGSLAGVLTIRAVAANPHTARFTPLQGASVISLTVLGVLLAGSTCALLNRLSRRPLASFRSVALGALALSLIPDVAIWLTAHYPQTRAATVLPLMAMHVLVASVCLGVLPWLGRSDGSTAGSD